MSGQLVTSTIRPLTRYLGSIIGSVLTFNNYIYVHSTKISSINQPRSNYAFEIISSTAATWFSPLLGASHIVACLCFVSGYYIMMNMTNNWNMMKVAIKMRRVNLCCWNLCCKWTCTQSFPHCSSHSKTIYLPSNSQLSFQLLLPFKTQQHHTFSTNALLSYNTVPLPNTN